MTNAELFKDLIFDNIHRRGITDFMTWLENDTDFFTAPASTKYHGSYEGGLVDHSLSVHHNIIKLAQCYTPELIQVQAGLESLTLVSLLHDVCKHNMYEKAKAFRKDSYGKWEEYDRYIVSDKAPQFGAHGAYSVFLIQQYITLTDVEAMAIYHHMGAWDKSTYDYPAQAYQYHAIPWLLHVADEAATYIDGI